jgi:hypothetical protein
MIEAYCVHDMTILRFTGEDDQRTETPRTEIPVKGYFKRKEKLFRDIKGDWIQATGYVWIIYSATLTEMDRLKYGLIEYEIVSIEDRSTFSANIAIKFWVR